MDFKETSQFKSVLELNEMLNNFSTSEVTDEYQVLNPIQFFNRKSGTNWDYCIAEAHKLRNEIGIPSVCCYSLEIGDDFINFIVFKNELYWYWFESFDKENKGIHEFKSWIRMINFITHKYGVKNSNFKLGLRQINPLDSSVFGMNATAYRQFISSSPIIEIRDTKIEEPDNYINENGVMRKYSDTSENGVENEGNEGVETRTLTDEKPKRTSANFVKGIKILKTKGRSFSINECWDMFVRRFSGDSDMQKSLQLQVQRLLTKARMSVDQNQRKAYLEEANQLRSEGSKYYSGDQLFYSGNNPYRHASIKMFADDNKQNDQQNNQQTSTATDNKPATPSNMDHESHSNGNDDPQQAQQRQPERTYTTRAQGNGLEQLGQQGGMMIADVNQQKIDEQNGVQDDPHQQQQAAAPKKQGGVGGFLRKLTNNPVMQGIRSVSALANVGRTVGSFFM